MTPNANKIPRRRVKAGREKIDALIYDKLQNKSLDVREIYNDLIKTGVLETYAGVNVSEPTVRRWAMYIMVKHRLYRIPKTVHIAQLLLADWAVPKIAEYVRVPESTVYAVFCSSKRKFNDARTFAL